MHCSFALSFVLFISTSLARMEKGNNSHAHQRKTGAVTAMREGDGEGEPLALTARHLPPSLAMHFYFVTQAFHFVQSRGAAFASVLRLCYKILTKKNHTTFFFQTFSLNHFSLVQRQRNPSLIMNFEARGVFYSGVRC